MKYLNLVEMLAPVMTKISLRSPTDARLDAVLALLATAKAILEGSDYRANRSGKLAFKLWEELPKMETSAAITDPEIATLIAYFVKNGPDEVTGDPASFLVLIGGKPGFAAALAVLGQQRHDFCNLELMTSEVMGWDKNRTVAAFMKAQAMGWLVKKS